MACDSSATLDGNPLRTRVAMGPFCLATLDRQPQNRVVGGRDRLVEPHRVNRSIDVANQYRHVGPVVTGDAKSPKRVTSIHRVR